MVALRVAPLLWELLAVGETESEEVAQGVGVRDAREDALAWPLAVALTQGEGVSEAGAEGVTLVVVQEESV